MKHIQFEFITSAVAQKVADMMIASYPSEFEYVHVTGRKVKFRTDFPKRTRIAVKKVVSAIENV